MFDSHVHAGPDVVDRFGDDLVMVDAYGAADFDGFVLKAHYESTVARAHLASKHLGKPVLGGIALNQHCGGVNPGAVAAALSAGGRVVWLPTADSHTQHAAGLPRLCHVEPRAGEHTYAVPPVDPSAAEATDVVLALVADHDAVLATGHIGPAECRWIRDRAAHHGVRRLLYTHPSYTVPGMEPALVAELAAGGGYVEITAFQLFHQPGCTPAFLAKVAEAAGDRLILSSDAGQPDSPSPPEALAQLVDALAAEGLDRGWLEAAAQDAPTDLFLAR
jgi:hypothetical protein